MLLELRNLRQGDQDFEASFNYIVNLMGDMSYYTPSKEEEVVGVYLSCSRACLADTEPWMPFLALPNQLW